MRTSYTFRADLYTPYAQGRGRGAWSSDSETTGALELYTRRDQCAVKRNREQRKEEGECRNTEVSENGGVRE